MRQTKIRPEAGLLAESNVLSGQVGDDIDFVSDPKHALDNEFEHPMSLNQPSRNLHNANGYEFLRTTAYIESNWLQL